MSSPKQRRDGRDRKSIRLLAGLSLAATLVGGFAINAYGGGMPGLVSAESRFLRGQINSDAPELAPVYEARRFEPIWVQGGKVRPEAQALMTTLAAAKQDGLEPERFGLSTLQRDFALAQTGEPQALARFEAQASRAYVDYVIALHTPSSGEQMTYTDPAAAPPAMTPLSVLLAAAEAPSLADHIASVRQMNPIYEDLRGALAAYRHNPKMASPGVTEDLLLLNLDRARALPANPGPRYIVVDTTAAMLWMYENGRRVDSMKVIVGKHDDPTPLMAGMLRYALFNPYWNVPEDLVRDSWAPRVLREGVGVIPAKQMEALSDWSPNAKVLDPSAVDWEAVAAGRQYLRLRQMPGPTNMMGKVKFMMPNDLGIYLHDTPNRALFEQDARWFSAGCVRVQDAERLTRWLFGKRPAATTADHRVDLQSPVPVYMIYLTVSGSRSGVVTRSDIYGWDSQIMARRQSRNRAAA